MSDRVFAKSGRWLLASDGMQWMLCCGDVKYPVSFVRSTKEILARCMHDKGVPANDAAALLAGLPETFDQWLAKKNPHSARRALAHSFSGPR